MPTSITAEHEAGLQMTSQPQSIDQVARVAQIITLGLVMGAVTMGALTVFIMRTAPAPAPGVLVSSLAALAAGAAFVLHFVAPSLMVKRQLRSTTGEQLPGLYLMKTIQGLAILEGAVFFNLVAAMIEHNVWSLAIAGGLLFWMLAMFPTQTRVAHWVESQQMHRGEM
ncbi:MAG: hypothetical protein KF861_15565 [Planctomycetaceae bacterium]|nr:hypothetical protein [Planctomycetaceae bacterium]